MRKLKSLNTWTDSKLVVSTGETTVSMLEQAKSKNLRGFLKIWHSDNQPSADTLR